MEQTQELKPAKEVISLSEFHRKFRLSLVVEKPKHLMGFWHDFDI